MESTIDVTTDHAQNRLPNAAEYPFSEHSIERIATRDSEGIHLPDTGDAAWKPFLTYTDRTSYLKWVADWKSVYRELSVAQRLRKTVIREAGSSASAEQWRALIGGKLHARGMLALRAAAKLDSASRRREGHETV